ncbi:MAG TPA: hemerythrin domain-containing protein [Rhodospirillaceae bacterium]|nr:hemerythrin domain-containing protein [Rhodospirillaceae bacterium]
MHGSTTIGALLHEEHLHTIATLQRLEEFLGSQTSRKLPDLGRPEVKAVLESLSKELAPEVEIHYGFEEGHLFPLLANAGQAGMVHLLTSEHRALLPLAKGLAAMVEAAVAAGQFTAGDWSDFHGQAMDLCEGEVFHIQKEEMGLLAAISAFVDAAEDERLAAIYGKLSPR